MTAVTSKMNRMVLLYMLALSMVSLPTSLARHLLVEVADNQRGDTDFLKGPLKVVGEDYQGGSCWTYCQQKCPLCPWTPWQCNEECRRDGNSSLEPAVWK